MSKSQKVKAAVEIFKAEMAGAKGRFRAYASDDNANEVDILSEAGLYCVVNIRSGRIKLA